MKARIKNLVRTLETTLYLIHFQTLTKPKSLNNGSLSSKTEELEFEIIINLVNGLGGFK